MTFQTCLRSRLFTFGFAVSMAVFAAACDGGGSGGTGGTGGETGGSGGTGATGGQTGGTAGSGGSTGGTAGTAGTGGTGGGPVSCGGTSGHECDATEYCDYASGADCNSEEAGICVPRPETCTEDCPGVCGCDGKFYCNGCMAAQAGVDVDEAGQCSKPQVVCGGLGGAICSDTEYCDYPDDQICGAFDGTGLCTPRPEICPDDCPGVCACDGTFYCNACMAAAAGLDVNVQLTCMK